MSNAVISGNWKSGKLFHIFIQQHHVSTSETSKDVRKIDYKISPNLLSPIYITENDFLLLI